MCSPLVTTSQGAATWETKVRAKWKNTVAAAADGQLEGTHVVLDVQVAAGFEQDAHNLDVAFVGSQVQRASAILWRHTTQRGHSSAQSARTKERPQKEQTVAAFTNPPTLSAATRSPAGR